MDNIIVFGGDGFCGWPTSLRLSKEGYRVVIVDDFSRRKIDTELDCYSLTPIESMETRLKAWKEVTGNEIQFVKLNISKNYGKIFDLISTIKPKAIVHFAEQRAAPYSMKSPYHKRYTVNRNVTATNNIMCAIAEAELDTHMVHLGTMGVYGYGDIEAKIPEGYLKVKVDVEGEDKELEILYPASPGSVYHMTKTLDALMFHYYNKNDQLRITDLHQGIVWGTNIEETSLDPRLINRFDYDGDYGTALNRFLMQAAIGHPLTVYGTGGQRRAFIHIRDTANCIRLAIENPPDKGERVKIFNQVTEVHTLNELAKKISDMTGAEIRYFDNPRKEMAENFLEVSNEKFLSLGLNPITLDEGLMDEVMKLAGKYKDRCDRDKIICTSTWRPDMKVDFIGDSKPRG